MVAIVVMALAGVVGAAALLHVVPAMVRSVVSSRRIAAPGESRVHLAAGRHLIYERTGTKSGGGGFTVTRAHGITLSEDQVSVTTASGAPLARPEGRHSRERGKFRRWAADAAAGGLPGCRQTKTAEGDRHRRPPGAP